MTHQIDQKEIFGDGQMSTEFTQQIFASYGTDNKKLELVNRLFVESDGNGYFCDVTKTVYRVTSKSVVVYEGESIVKAIETYNKV